VLAGRVGQLGCVRPHQRRGDRATTGKIFAADALDDRQLGGVLMRMGWVIKDHCRIVEEKRCELWRMLHPIRDHFEKEGWPGEAA
jgi:hypothetical protein